MQWLIGVAKWSIIVSTVASVLIGGVIGAGAFGVLGFLLGSAVGFVAAGVVSGLAAAVLEIHQQLKELNGTMLRLADRLDAPPPGGGAQQQVPRDRGDPEDWPLVVAKAEALGWKAEQGVRGLTRGWKFTNLSTGESFTADDVNQARRRLKLV